MKNDWKILQIIFIVVIVFNGCSDFLSYTQNDSVRFPFQSFILSVITLIVGLIYFIFKKGRYLLGVLFFVFAGNTAAFCIMMIPQFFSTWIYILLNLVLVYLEILVGLNLINNKVRSGLLFCQRTLTKQFFAFCSY